MKTKKIIENVWQISGGIGLTSYVYLLTFKEPILIDLGSRINSDLLVKALGLIGYKKEDIKKVIFTHLHFDHIGQPSLFKNAKFYASEDEIISFKFSPKNTVLGDYKELEEIKLNKLDKEINGLTVINTAGHTRGSVCFYLKDKKILFSGDTIFPDNYGRTDLPTSMPKKMENSIIKLKNINYEILCPGH